MDARFSHLIVNGGVTPTLLATENPGADVQGILLRLVAGVARDLEGPPGRMEDRVHDIRVRMKKFRAILRLAESRMTGPAFARSDKLARTLKDYFGSARDNDVQTDLLLDLLDKSEAHATAKALGLMDRNPATETDPASARETCAQLAALVERFQLSGLTGDEVVEAWIASYRNSRRAMRACCRDANDDFLFHEWRKRVKEMLYQSVTIGPPLDKYVLRADRLASALGSHHDLAILTESLASGLAGSKAERAALARKKVVGRRAVAMGRKLFAEKPSVIHRKVRLP